METIVLIFFLIGTSLVEGLPQKYEKLEIERQLKLLNKPALKTFQTRYGDIIDCVEIEKQLAFDHPSLKNHTIQMKPSSNSEIAKEVGDSIFAIPKNMRCPEGSVPIKRIEEQDLQLLKFTPSFANDGFEDHKVAGVIMPVENSGIHGIINIWQPEAQNMDQFSAAIMHVVSEDGSVNNGIAAGWSVQPGLYSNFTRLVTYWTKDSGKTTGCFNVLCPGFVQISKEITLGIILLPTSIYGGPQFDMEMAISQDWKTKHWWLYLGGKAVGYFPKGIFTTLSVWATKGGWGGEVQSPETEVSPAMGSGHLPSEGFEKACFIRQMKMYDASQSRSIFFPNEHTILRAANKPQCYDVLYSDSGEATTLGHSTFFGGPPNCMF